MKPTKRHLVIYQNEKIVVVEKPAGWLVIDAPKKQAPNLTTILNQSDQIDLQSTTQVHPCHRLDQDTSGVMIYAKGKKMQAAMMQLFREKKISKTYIAYIQGHPPSKEGVLKSRIQHLDFRRRGQQRTIKPAETKYKLLKRYDAFSEYEVQPITGQTNQIRIQFSRWGYPLVGDRKYSIVKNYPVRFRRSALHASQVSWMCPDSKKQKTFSSPLPDDMRQFVEKYS